ncbi:MAG: hypothetical protein AMXMBFR59_19310 [Rhodanobacteraceae bacterium]
MGDDAAACVVVGQRPDGIARAAKLERAHALELFALEMKFGAGELVQAVRAQHRSDAGMWCDACRGIAYVGKGDAGRGFHGAATIQADAATC